MLISEKAEIYILRSVRPLQKVILNTSYSVRKQENKIFPKKKKQNNNIIVRTWSYLLSLFIWRRFFIIVLIFLLFSNNAHCRIFWVRRNLKAGTFNVVCMRIMKNGLTGLKILHVQTQMFWRLVLMLSAGFSIVHGEQSSTPTTIQAGIHMYGTSGLLFSWLVFWSSSILFVSRY